MSVECEHWHDCGVYGGGCCKLKKYGGRPSEGTCHILCLQDRWAPPVALSQNFQPQKFPPLIQEAQNLAGCVGRTAKALVTRKKVLAPPEIRAERIAICEECEYFAKDKVRCYKCGCKLLAKVALATEKCPADKWAKISEVPEWQELLP